MTLALGRVLKMIVSDALEEHGGKVSISNKKFTNLRCANDIDTLVGKEQELKDLD